MHRLMPLFVFSLVFTLSAVSHALVRTSYDWGGVSLTLVIDDNDIIRVDSLPIEDLTLLYNKRSQTIFAHLAGQPISYSIPFDTYGRFRPEPQLVAGGEWEPYLDEPSRFWQTQVNGDTCAHIFTNEKAARQARMNMADLSRIQAALAYLFGPPPPAKCPPYIVPAAHGILMGLPLHLIKQGGEGGLELIAIEDIDGTLHELPTPQRTPLTAEAHMQFLMAMLPEHTQAVFQSSSAHLPHRQQVRALKILLNKLNEDRLAD